MRLVPKQEAASQTRELIIREEGKPEIRISSNDVWSFFKELDDVKTLYDQKEFRISHVSRDTIWIIPEQTGIERPIKLDDFMNVWNRYVMSRSTKIADYQGISRNASYIIAVIILYFESKLGA